MGEQLKVYGFEYFKSEPNTWIFKRKYLNVDQFVNIFESNFSQAIRLELYTSIDACKIMEIRNFCPDWEQKFMGKYFWEYDNEESFVQILNEFVQIIIQYGIKALNELSIPTRETLIQTTPEMHINLFENHGIMCKYFIEKYKVSVHNVKQGLEQIIKLMKENRDTNYEEMKDLLLEMAAYYGEALITQFGGAWKWDKNDEICILEIKKNSRIEEWLPLHDIVTNWVRIDKTEDYLFQLYNELCLIMG